MEPKQSKENALFEWYDSLVFALAVIVLFFVFAVRIITVSGVSMQPTLYGGDRVAVQSMLYTPQRGDVVVVDGYINYGDPLVKRIIALGGGVSGAGEFLLNAVRAKLPELVFYKSMKYARIELARLGNDAGIIGAAMLGR